MQRRRLSPILVLLLWGATFSLAQAETTRFPITATQISQVLLPAALALTPGDIELPLPLSTAVDSPHLAIRGADPLGETHLRLRINCTVPGECLPFFVVLNLHDKKHASAAQDLLNSSFSPALPISPASTPVVRAGERAVLLLEDHHMQITLPVITIDTGKLGTEVRVTSLDRKQTYRGFVIETGVIRGALP